MRRIVDPGALLLGRDLAIEVGRHAVEISDHAFDLRNPAPLLVDLEFPQANERLTRLHRLVLPRSPDINSGRSRTHGATSPVPAPANCGSTTLVFGFRTADDFAELHIGFGKRC